MYNFAANIGDTLHKVAIGDDYLMDTVDFYVEDKDSFLLNNKYYTTLKVHEVNGNIETVWYENIGCPNGLLTSPSGFNSAILACYSNKDSLVDIGYLPYVNIHTHDTVPAYPGGNCYYELHIGISELTRNNELSIYPNPCGENLSLTLSTREGMQEVKIYDVVGNEVRSFDRLRMTVNGEKSVTIDVSGLAKGMYFVEVHLSPALSTGERETTLRKKFIKE